ncbi:hypothetical protein TARUN_3965 [Trichoderma arundinaceum]|uniref:Uncharacterized protein n=1 Tax=Trichoderma arundinaceum TaxID=490622 RepID=A0A395NR04_TRIAR|nr:hypothetical protein TARUN_3965 [Trichoderma arundinaceum]
MPPFKAPWPGNQRTRNHLWAKAAHTGMGDPDRLWGDYWNRFNTIQIPIFDDEEYFETAIAILKASKDEQDFERKFEETNKQRQEVLLSLMSKAAGRAVYHDKVFPCKAAWNTVLDVCQTGCFEHFLRLLQGTAFGWEADVVDENADHEARSDDNDNVTNHLSEEMYHSAEEETTSPIQGETQHSMTEERVPIDDYDYSFTAHIPQEWETQHLDDWDCTYVSPAERKARQDEYTDNIVFIGTYSEYKAPTSEGAAHRAPDFDDEVPSIQQLPPLLSSDTSISEKGDAGRRTRGVLGAQPCSPSDEGDSALSNKRVRFSDDDFNGHDFKRRKLETSTAHTSTAHASSSLQQATGGSVTRKRSRPDDDDEDNGYKRQKIESLPSPPTSHTSSTLSTEDIPTDHPPPGISDKASENQISSTNSSRRKRRKQQNTSSRTPRAKSSRNASNTRSLRKAKSPTFWELDSSGKPHSIR